MHKDDKPNSKRPRTDDSQKSKRLFIRPYMLFAFVVAGKSAYAQESLTYFKDWRSGGCGERCKGERIPREGGGGGGGGPKR